MIRAILLLTLVAIVRGYQVLLEGGGTQQICSGMWGGAAEIEVVFSAASRGQVALVIFESRDARFLGITPTGASVDSEPTYVCTLDAVARALCGETDLGRFISTAPAGNSSIFTSSVRFDAVSSPSKVEDQAAGTGPYHYAVHEDGYYCVGVVPLVAQGASAGYFAAVIDFRNVFKGHLPASEYPKIALYLTLGCIYLAIGIAWAVLFIQNRDLTTLQYYIAGTIAFLVAEHFAIYSYYMYLNTDSNPGIARFLHVLIAIMGAGRASVSLFLLLITSLGLGVVRTSLGATMLRARLLTGVHLGFGVLYSLGSVSIRLETAGLFIFFFVVPLSLSLTTFLLWIMAALTETISELRRQSYKRQMYTSLYRILCGTVLAVFAFFIVSSLSFSSRKAAEYGQKTWKTQWILLDGWLGILYLLSFSSIVLLWRPSRGNRQLAMFSELAADEDEAGEFEVEDLERREGGKDAVPLRSMREDDVVFELGADEGSEDEEGEGDVGRAGEHRRLRERDSDDDDDEQGEEGPPSYKRS